jgi:hypothetical protein
MLFSCTKEYSPDIHQQQQQQRARTQQAVWDAILQSAYYFNDTKLDACSKLGNHIRSRLECHSHNTSFL